MITTADFKKQIAKPFGQEMRLYGFKGTGFEYLQNTEDYLIAVYIDPSRWGGSCSAGFAIHPIQVDKDYNGKKDLTKLKTYQYEFKFSLTKFARGEKWEYNNDEATNLLTLSKIMDVIKNKAFPVIEKFKATPNILEQFEVTEMNKFHDNWGKRAGIFIATTDLRFAWAMTIIFENKNLQKAKEFAEWAVSHPDNSNTEWFGNKDFRRVLTKKTIHKK
jgi:hypothetical protein